MPFTTRESTVFLEGPCSIEGAEPLHEALRAIAEPVFDLSRAGHLHTSIVQLVAASAVEVRGMAPDRMLEACLRDRLAG